MSQEEVVRKLKNRNWMTSREIAKLSHITESTACVNLNRLYKFGEILRRTEFMKPKGVRYLWKLKEIWKKE